MNILIRTLQAVAALSSAKPEGRRAAKTSRIEHRASENDRNLLDRAAAALGTDRSSFLLAQGRLAAQRVLADREQTAWLVEMAKQVHGTGFA